MVQKQEGHKIVNFWMTDEDLARLDVITDKDGYHNRADTIRTLIRIRYEVLVGSLNGNKKIDLAPDVSAPSLPSSPSSGAQA